MSSKLDLTAKVLANQLATSEDVEAAIKEGIKSFAVEALNQAQYLREKNVEAKTAQGLMLGLGIGYNLKTKKFF